MAGTGGAAGVPPAKLLRSSASPPQDLSSAVELYRAVTRRTRASPVQTGPEMKMMQNELRALFYTKGWGSVPISAQRRFVTVS